MMTGSTVEGSRTSMGPADGSPSLAILIRAGVHVARRLATEQAEKRMRFRLPEQDAFGEGELVGVTLDFGGRSI